MVTTDNHKKFFEYLNNVQDHVSEKISIFYDDDSTENSNSNADATLLKVITDPDTNNYLSKIANCEPVSDDFEVPTIQVTELNSALFTITEVLLVNVITEKVEWSKLSSSLYNDTNSNKNINALVREDSFSFINNKDLNLNSNNIDPALKVFAKWLIRIGNWTIKYSGYLINPNEGGSLSVFELIELILKESENNDEIIFKRLETIQESLEYLDRILGNDLFENIINEIKLIIRRKDKQSLQKMINELRSLLGIVLTPTSWVNNKSQEFADSIYTDQRPEPEPEPIQSN